VRAYFCLCPPSRVSERDILTTASFSGVVLNPQQPSDDLDDDEVEEEDVYFVDVRCLSFPDI
jgi:hypothetical protein